MRNKELFERKLDRLNSLIKNIGYHIHRDERDQAYKLVGRTVEFIEDMQTLLNTEVQD